MGPFECFHFAQYKGFKNRTDFLQLDILCYKIALSCKPFIQHVAGFDAVEDDSTETRGSDSHLINFVRLTLSFQSFEMRPSMRAKS